MRTSIDLPDPLFRQAKARAELDGTTLKELITRFVAQGLGLPSSGGTPVRGRRRSDLPIARPAIGKPLPLFSNAELYRLLEEDELSKGTKG